MTLDDTLARTAHALVAGAAPGPGPVAATERARVRIRRRRGVAGIGVCVLVVLAVMTIGWWRAATPERVSADGVATLAALARIADAQGPAAPIPDGAAFVFVARPSNADQLPHRVDGGDVAAATTTVTPDGSGRTVSALGEASAETGFTPGGGPVFTVDPAVVRRFAAGEIDAAGAVGAARRGGVAGLATVGALLAQPGVGGAQRAQLFSFAARLSGVSVTSGAGATIVSSGSTSVVFDPTTSAVLGLDTPAESWTLISVSLG